ncbi:MAG TPA: hypothetical protein VFA85_06540 [Terriglobales bacterium]|nr:hypothetical protein [Terriglobales bacterium]
MNVAFFDEPELEFGAGRHIDIRFGIMNYGPLDFESSVAPRQINVGVVGTKESIEGLQQWLERCRTEIPGKRSKSEPDKPSNKPNLFPKFPGYSANVSFRSTLILSNPLCRDFQKSAIEAIVKVPDRKTRIERSVDLFMEEIRYLAQNTPAKVIICAVPLPLLDAMASSELNEDEDDDDPTPDIAGTQIDFHDMLKARAMQLYRKPIQIVLPSTYDESKRRRQRRTGRRRELQDEATRAWNIHTALYYKADGVPWRLVRDSNDLTVCYVGVSFYRSLDSASLLTSVAQVFNERGEGVVVRGGAASISKDDLQAHLSEEAAHQLLADALSSYWDVHRTFPARLVVHKSSRFDDGERAGFEAAVKEKGISTHDFLWVSNSSTRLYRGGQYPPLRGTLLMLDDSEMLLYTRGSVEFFETYPGKYLPVPLRIRCESTEQTQRFLAREVLALSKMNWNNTQFDGADPVTLRASRQCSGVLRYCSTGLPIEPRYSFYM